MEKRFVVITGHPGAGKTTLVRRVIERLRGRGTIFVGFYCPEVRVSGRRVGFRIESIDGKLSAWLARIDECDGPRVGRYITCSEAEEVAEESLKDLTKADLVVIDEIGPMELKLPGVRKSILQALRSGKPGLFVAHYRLSDPEIVPILRSLGYWFEVTPANRDNLINKVYSLVLRLVKK
jgi:nucleoside-triphosphatase